MTDELASKIVQKLAPRAGYPHVQTQAEEEATTGPKSPSERGGRLPKFYRHEVDEIRNSLDRSSILAERYGVSVETIKRVREVGRYRGIPYIPRDEMDRRLDPDRPKPKKSDPAMYRKGRPYKTGRAKLTDEERRLIAHDIRSIPETAEAFDVSQSLVKKIRQAFGTAHMRTGPLSHRIIRNINVDERPIAVIAEEQKLPPQIVRSIKEGTFSQKLKGQN